MIRTPQKIYSTTFGTSSATLVTVLPVGDFDSIIGKISGTLAGVASTQDIYIQTTDDGGTTFYDVVHFGQFTGTTGTYIGSNAAWAVLQAGGGQGKYVGSIATASIAAASISGLPLVSRTIQIQNVAAGTVGTSTLTLALYASQSGGF